MRAPMTQTQDTPGLIARRTFLAGFNLSLGGLALGFFAPSAWAAAGATSPVSANQQPLPAGLQPNVFVHVAADGQVTIVCQRSEMGQGIRSSLPVLIADELGADPATIRILQAEGDAKYGDQNTDGSASVRTIYDEMRQAGATARTMLVAVAAKRWKVKPDRCEARGGKVLERGGKRAFGFGELVAEAAKLKVPAAASVQLRPKAELLRTGKDLPLVDARAYVTGAALFGADIRLPGMLTAVIARPPVVGGRLLEHDARRTLAVPGVKKVIVLPPPQRPWRFQAWGGVAVLADNTWSAMRGREALQLTWDDGPNADYDSDAFRETLSASVRAPGTVLRKRGDAEAALKQAAKVLEAEYHVPHLPHVSMEPPVAVAWVHDGKCEVWASTQNPQDARAEAARVLGWPEEKVEVRVTFLGGGFGRKSKADFVAEAVALAKEAGVPVRVQWTREDDLLHDYYNTVSAQRLTAGLDASGKVIAWRHRTAFPPIGSTFNDAEDRPKGDDLQQGVTDLALDVPNVAAEGCVAKAHVRIGWLRSVYNIFHAFSVNVFIDELAQLKGVDPHEMQLEVRGPPRLATLDELGISKLRNYGGSLTEYPVDVGRLRATLERATALARWDQRKQDGRALGLAVHRSFNSYTAAVASVIKRPDGRIGVDEVWLVIDGGTLINTDRVRSQMEGSVIFGMSLALYGAATMKRGVTQQTNFRALKLVRMADAPRKIHVDLIQSDARPGGVGEPGVPPVAPAIVNAIFALTGTRVRDLPIARSLDV